MKKTIFVFLLALIITGCSQHTKTSPHTTYTFKGTIVGIDLLPELAEMNLSLTKSLIQDGFLFRKEGNAIAIKQIRVDTTLSFEEQNNISRSTLGKWHIASLPFQTTISLTNTLSRTITIQGKLLSGNYKASPILLILQEGIRESLQQYTNYRGYGHLINMQTKKLTNDIQIFLKVVMIDYER